MCGMCTHERAYDPAAGFQQTNAGNSDCRLIEQPVSIDQTTSVAELAVCNPWWREAGLSRLLRRPVTPYACTPRLTTVLRDYRPPPCSNDGPAHEPSFSPCLRDRGLTITAETCTAPIAQRKHASRNRRFGAHPPTPPLNLQLPPLHDLHPHNPRHNTHPSPPTRAHPPRNHSNRHHHQTRR